MTKEELQKQLTAKNAAIKTLVDEHASWMDEHMHRFAKVPVGEDIYNIQTGELLGRVVGHYRFWAEQNPLLDISFEVECSYENAFGVIDNTSSQPHIRFGTLSMTACTLQESSILAGVRE